MLLYFRTVKLADSEKHIVVQILTVLFSQINLEVLTMVKCELRHVMCENKYG